MRLYSTNTSGTWLNSEDLTDADGSVLHYGSRNELRGFLSDCLTSTNLVVLTGLGTSLCINSASAQAGLPTAPTMWELWKAAKAKVGDQKFSKVLSATRYEPDDGQENIEELLSRCKISSEYLGSGSPDALEINDFVSATEEVIRESCDFVGPKTPLGLHETFLSRIGRRSARKPRTRVYTTNYDKCFEEAARRRRFVVVDGFSFSLPSTYDPGNYHLDIVRRDRNSDTPDFFENVFQFFKLHGSIDWSRKNGEVIKEAKPVAPLLIYPRSSKYEQAFEPPYLDMMSSFQSTLRGPDTALLVIGFGFNDDHISKPIMAALQANLRLKVAVCVPSFYRDEDEDDAKHSLPSPDLSNAYHARMRALIDAGDTRVRLIRATFEELVPEIPDLSSQNERERHADRFRGVTSDD